MTRFRSVALFSLILLSFAAFNLIPQRETVSSTILSDDADSGVTRSAPGRAATRPPDSLVAGRSSPPVVTRVTPENESESILTSTPVEIELDANSHFESHVVVDGETLTDVAARYETSVATIQELNGLVDPHNLLVGQELIVSVGLSGPGVIDKSMWGGEFERSLLGESAGGHPIESFRIGHGRFHVIVVGALHGGYEWNSALLAYRLLTYFTVYPERVLEDVTLHLIPVANPDGIVAVTGQTGPFMASSVAGDTTIGRPNGKGVDLNRNWGCDWSPEALWRESVVSGGTRPFSEPETRALRDYFLDIEPQAVLWLHSAAGLVAPGNCKGIDHQASNEAAALYAAQAGYPVGGFNAYRVTGDASDWLAQHKIASFTVELTNHQDLEFARNLAGLLSLLEGIKTLNGD